MPETKNPFLTDPLADKAVVFAPGEGQVIPIQGGAITLKITSEISNDQLGLYEITLQPGVVGARLHFHRYMDETFIVNQGSLTVTHGHSQVEAKAGSVIFVPRFTPHGFANTSAQPVTLTLIFNPAQRREGFFFGLAQILNTDPVNPQDFLALYNRYDSYPVDSNTLSVSS
jgi:mannose-6-phosphate isomerase-like protein (cupin superfamily)